MTFENKSISLVNYTLLSSKWNFVNWKYLPDNEKHRIDLRQSTFLLFCFWNIVCCCKRYLAIDPDRISWFKIAFFSAFVSSEVLTHFVYFCCFQDYSNSFNVKAMIALIETIFLTFLMVIWNPIIFFSLFSIAIPFVFYFPTSLFPPLCLSTFLLHFLYLPFLLLGLCVSLLLPIPLLSSFLHQHVTGIERWAEKHLNACTEALALWLRWMFFKVSIYQTIATCHFSVSLNRNSFKYYIL